ncbi:MAG: hypothetical protein LBN03_02410 [Bifidobacteriaceae bacterium]|nr:hypothetical protein [Bifidobacteriaceae bacterium]
MKIKNINIIKLLGIVTLIVTLFTCTNILIKPININANENIDYSSEYDAVQVQQLMEKIESSTTIEEKQILLDELLEGEASLNMQDFQNYADSKADIDYLYFSEHIQSDGSIKLMPSPSGNTFVHKWCDGNRCGYEIHISKSLLQTSCLVTVAGITAMLVSAGVITAGASSTFIAKISEYLLTYFFGSCFEITNGMWIVTTYTPVIIVNSWGWQ